MGNLLLAVALLPFIFLAGRDAAMHVRLRKTPPWENLVHLAVGAGLVWFCVGVFRRDVDGVAVGMCLFLPPAIADEVVWHRGIPEVETRTHAAQHLALLSFVIVAALVWGSERGVFTLGG